MLGSHIEFVGSGIGWKGNGCGGGASLGFDEVT